MTIASPHISVKNLNVYIGEAHILKNISIDIPDKKVTSFIGPSGCGKTTLLKTLNRLLDNNSTDVRIEGKVLVDGEDLYAKDTEVTHIRKKMGLLSQRPFPLPMSIYDNIAYGPRIHGERDKKVLDEIVERYLKATALWDEVKDRLHGPATRLSIGQQQRLCLARGLAIEPEIILGDEPTSALDPVSTQRIEELFLQLKDNYTLVLVTHILRQARRVSDYIAFIYMGEIVEFAPTEELLLNPKEKMTKDYIRGYVS
ncbi:MAG TPA: phosphate ABC transporter ATP-binding protein PstB [Bacteroidia bacterium]|jgi:phosphate transport system ATP-binding protein|nr:phosphate ABC transporter ATP-binding protein PstB [Bacteroidia bacterium]HRG52697.1 phosphate ABC transporter ATP-binding protein PstB [Bacteroidia bacterium]